ncbi:hypothetical protein [Bordetella flabilis]|uniref:hypothetical protein n=1 Tax=Bordetella flabilis TaxID=463014 RepID=UPI0012F506B4|nr:hypothetical protein [Bordetella flabilis]
MAALLLGSSLSAPAAADDFRVPFIDSLSDPSSDIFDPASEYGGTMRYFVDPSSSYMTFVVNGLTYSVDWSSKIDEAIQEWQQAVGQQLSFTRVTDAGQANVVIRTGNSSVVGGPTQLAGTRVRLGSGSPTTINFYTDQFQRYFSDENTVRPALAYMNGGTAADLLNFVTRLAAKHELGHALGLAEFGTRAGPGVRVAIPTGGLGGTPPVVAPIMAPNPFLYIRMLFAQNNRMAGTPNESFVPSAGESLLIADMIGIAPAEAEALITLMRAQRATCSSSSMWCIKPPYIDHGGGDDDEL